jgi:hypothetical protein
MTDEGERWEDVTGENAFRKREIETFGAVRGEMCHLYAFWCRHIPKGGAERANGQLNALYVRLMEVPMTGLLRRRQGADEINKDWYENEEDELNTKHKHKLLASWQQVWRDMVAIDEEAERTWKMSVEVKAQYEIV